MARNNTYAVNYYGRKLLDEYRGDRIEGLEYVVTKFDQFGGEEDVYHVVQSTFGEECTCKAAHRHTCRHREMVNIFKAAERTDTDWRYNYDEKIEARKWRSIAS
jgi:hypothetical protein